MIAEEFGLIGSVFILLIYLAVVMCGVKIAINAKNKFGCYLATGITSIIAVQTLLNIAVVSGSIPPTGLPLPFISSGSTSIVVFMSAVGVLLNIEKQNNEKQLCYNNISSQFLHKKKKLKPV